MTDQHPQPPHEIPTSRLTLRSARTGDGEALHDAIRVSLPDFFPWLSFSGQLSDVPTLDQVSQRGQEAFAAGTFYVWRAWEPEGTLVGSVDLHTLNWEVPSCSLGYWLRSDRRGHGYATEFASAVIDIAFQVLGMQRIEARCDVRNARSWRLAERLGFTLEGIARNDDRDAAGVLSSSRVYSRIRGSEQPQA